MLYLPNYILVADSDILQLGRCTFIAWFHYFYDHVCVRRAFYEEVGEHISKIDKEILLWTYRKDEGDTDEPKTLELDTILSADDDVSQWRERHQHWYAQR